MGLGRLGLEQGEAPWAVDGGVRPVPRHRPRPECSCCGCGCCSVLQGPRPLVSGGPWWEVWAVCCFPLLSARTTRRPPASTAASASPTQPGCRALGPRPDPLRWGLILTPTLGTSTFHTPGADAGAGEGQGASLLPKVVCTRAGGCRSHWDARSFSRDHVAPGRRLEAAGDAPGRVTRA